MGMLKFKSPALPLPRQEYDRQYFDQLVRILTIYFNQLDSNTPIQADQFIGNNFSGGNFDGDVYTGNNFNGGLFTGDGYGITLPHIAASDSTDQIAGGNNEPTVVEWNTLDSGFGWTLAAPGSATADYAGVYKITYSLQFINTANDIHYATVWLRVNNMDVANSATIFTVPARKSANPGEEGYTAAYSEVTFTVDAGDEIELYWATDLAGDPTVPTDGVYIFHDTAKTDPPDPYDRPAIPSAIGSITFVSATP